MAKQSEEKAMRMGRLVIKKLNGELTEMEAIELEQWLSSSEEYQQVHDEMMDGQTRERALGDGSPRDTLAVQEDVWSRYQTTQPRSFNRWRTGFVRTLIAAVILSTLSIGYYFWRSNQAQQIIVTAGKGKVYDVKLPDGSRVWLNSGASLSYPELFEGDKRSVILTDGQAFFEVSENPNKPFNIKAGTLNVQVLGTSFEVSAFKDVAQATVAVKTGSVKVGSESYPTDNGTTLTANQKATVNTTSGNIEVAQIDGDDIAGWKENRLVFTEESFATVIEALQRKYKVKIEVHQPNLYNEKITLRLEDEPLETILKVLSFSNQFTYQIANDSTVIIK